MDSSVCSHCQRKLVGQKIKQNSWNNEEQECKSQVYIGPQGFQCKCKTKETWKDEGQLGECSHRAIYFLEITNKI